MIHITYISVTITLCLISFYLGTRYKKPISLPWLNRYASPSEPVYDYAPEQAETVQDGINKVVEALEAGNKAGKQKPPRSWMGLNDG